MRSLTAEQSLSATQGISSGVIRECWPKATSRRLMPAGEVVEGKMSAMETSRTPFELSGRAGEVVVSYGENEDPVRWGYDLLGLDFPLEVSQGFPVFRADVTYDRDGYAAVLGWVQVVWMSVVGEATARAIVDVAPSLIGSGFRL